MNIAIITGASSGIGKELLFAIEKQYKFDEIWAISRRLDKLTELQENCATKIVPISLDLSIRESYDYLKKKLEEETPNVTMLVNCSGFGKFGEFSFVPLEDNINMIEVNCSGYAAVTHVTLPYMTKGSKILMVDSLSAFQPVPYQAIYGATKAFVLSFSRALNMELKERGIKVMVISPGWIKTEFFDRALVTNVNNEVNFYNKFYSPKEVADYALKDLKRNKEISILGLGNRLQVFMVKLLPHKMVMNTWLKQQGHKKRKDKNK